MKAATAVSVMALLGAAPLAFGGCDSSEQRTVQQVLAEYGPAVRKKLGRLPSDKVWPGRRRT